MTGSSRSTSRSRSGRSARPDLAEYLQRILTAKVYDVANETPLERANELSRRIGNTVLLKRSEAGVGSTTLSTIGSEAASAAMSDEPASRVPPSPRLHQPIRRAWTAP
jgi:hypothetical protein